MKHPHHDVLVAIAEGREVEYRYMDLPSTPSHWLSYTGIISPLSNPELMWRIKPEPCVPRVIWVNDYGDYPMYAWSCEAEADDRASEDRIACRKFVEVIEDE